MTTNSSPPQGAKGSSGSEEINPENGRVESISNSVSGITCTYQYDLMDRATNIVYKTANGSLIRGLEYEYNAASMIEVKRILNNEQGTPNFEVNYTYDSLDRLVHESKTSSVGNSLFDIHYSYDFAGNRTSVQSTIGNQQSTITYPLGMGNRLASTNMLYISGTANEPIGTDNRWGTLSVSNLTSGASTIPFINGNSFFAELPALAGQTNTVKAAIRDYAGNTSYPTKDYWIETTSSTNIINHHAYNDAGCLTNINGTTLEWDERYRLISVDGASSFVEYTYDVLNQRASRTSLAGGITNVEFYVYNGKQIIADLDGSGNLLCTYVWGTGIDNLLSMTTYTNGGSQASATYYAIKDHQNTIIALTDSTGTIVESYEYSAYGEILDVKDSSGNSIANQQSAIGNRYTFQGREIDWTTGLYYFRARWYNPETGRWLSKDPIGISGGLNLYVFCGNNPVNFMDPNGLDSLYIYGETGYEGAVMQRAGDNYDGVYYASSVEDAANYVENYANHVGPVDSVTIGGHGNEGVQMLGDEMFAPSGVVGRSGPVEQMGAAMEAGGVINLMGCDVAKGAGGEQYLSGIANSTGKRVTGSTGNQYLNPLTGKYTTFGKTVVKKPE